MIQNILNQLNRIEKLFILSMNVYQLLMTLKIYDINLTRSTTLYTGSSNTFKVSSNECFFPAREKALCMSHLNPEMITRNTQKNDKRGRKILHHGCLGQASCSGWRWEDDLHWRLDSPWTNLDKLWGHWCGGTEISLFLIRGFYTSWEKQAISRDKGNGGVPPMIWLFVCIISHNKMILWK